MKEITLPAVVWKAASLIYDAEVFVDQIATCLFVSPALSRMKPARSWDLMVEVYITPVSSVNSAFHFSTWPYDSLYMLSSN